MKSEYQEKQDKEITALVQDIFDKIDFVANLKIVIPRGYIKSTLQILPEHGELLSDRHISWRVELDMDGGLVLEIDRTNYPHWRREIVKRVDGDVDD